MIERDLEAKIISRDETVYPTLVGFDYHPTLVGIDPTRSR